MRKKSSRIWLKEHFNDPYVKQAQQAGYRSRAAYKLIELQEKDKLFKPGMTVIDLGAAPGSWSQLLIQWVGRKGKVIASDILPMDPIDNVEFIQGDFQNDSVLAQILNATQNSIDWVVSDMSPNLSGIESVDQARSIALAELAYDLASQVVHAQGGFLIKVFQGEGFDDFLRTLRQHFQKVTIRKPKASRGRSREVYIVASTKRS